MKRKFLTWLFKKNEAMFAEIIVEEFYGFIPQSLKEPVMDFMSGSRNALERFFTIQAYNIQKRSIGDIKNTQYSAGLLMHIKAVLLMVQRKGNPREEAEIPEEPKDNPLDRVKEFLNTYEKTNKREGEEKSS